ncbi:MAG: HAD-IC family P-type ATPase, partial [Myxococcales bacterium]|nr:HAD-IC family P-type ATPase [Polyangiaceae bacterium]MDW8251206.1 HAD-IC family P-type ATPase [Myxococcales bacterium]
VEGARTRGLCLAPVQSFRAHPGRGVEGVVEDATVLAGTAGWLREHGVDPAPLEPLVARLAAGGQTLVGVARSGRLMGWVTVADTVAPGARAAIDALRTMGVEVVMITGDREETARHVADHLGIPRVVAEVRPEQKAEQIRQEQARGRKVAMVGDGVNDAPALVAADVGIALGSGSDIAVASSDVTLVRGGIATLPTALRLARATLSTIRSNLFWAFLYNGVGIPIAAGVLAPWTDLRLSPVLASAAMSLSSVSVLLSSLRLRRFR